MGTLFAAIGATVAALLDVTVASRIQIADAQPQIVLVVGVLLTLIIGFEEGMTWAFVGGVFVDLLGFHPLGSTAFCLLAVVGLTESISPILARVGFARSVVAILVFTPVFIVLTTVTTGLLKPPTPQLHPTYVIAALLVNVLTAILVAPLFGVVRRRWEERARFRW